MDIFGTILWPFKWLISAILVGFHEAFTFLGMPSGSGWTWTLSIIGLVLVIRAALIPLFVKQIKAQRGMQTLQPELKKLQQKYKGKTDQLSRQAMTQEQMALYKKHGTNPFSACLPLIVQMPFFFSLFQVLNGLEHSSTIGPLNAGLIKSFQNASVAGAPLSASLLHGGGNGSQTAVVVLSILMIVAMCASQFITQKQIMAKNMSDEALASPFMKQQKLMLYVLPFVFAIGGINFPIGVLVYWLTTNVWTMCQQFYVIRRMPAPGSPAERAMHNRRAVSSQAVVRGELVAEDPMGRGQRQQPQRKDRAKKAVGPVKPRGSSPVSQRPANTVPRRTPPGVKAGGVPNKPADSKPAGGDSNNSGPKKTSKKNKDSK